jgi:hypothetical protein
MTLNSRSYSAFPTKQQYGELVSDMKQCPEYFKSWFNGLKDSTGKNAADLLEILVVLGLWPSKVSWTRMDL